MLVVFMSEVTKGSLERQGGVRGSKKISVSSIAGVWSLQRRN